MCWRCIIKRQRNSEDYPRSCVQEEHKRSKLSLPTHSKLISSDLFSLDGAHVRVFVTVHCHLKKRVYLLVVLFLKALGRKCRLPEEIAEQLIFEMNSLIRKIPRHLDLWQKNRQHLQVILKSSWKYLGA